MNIHKIIGSMLCLLILQTASADECADKIAELDLVDKEYQKDADMRVLGIEHLDILLLERGRLDNFTAMAGAGLVALSHAVVPMMGPMGEGYVQATGYSVGVIVLRNANTRAKLNDYKGRITIKGAQNARARNAIKVKRNSLEATNCGAEQEAGGGERDDEVDNRVVEGDTSGCLWGIFCGPGSGPSDPFDDPIPDGTVDYEECYPTGPNNEGCPDGD